MTTSEQSSETAAETAEPQTIEEIEAEIVQTREALGATVDELSQRLDVKGRAHDKVVDVKTAVQEKTADMGEKVKPIAQRREVQAAAGGAVLLGIGAAVVSRRRGK
jgi:hypothetical protein